MPIDHEFPAPRTLLQSLPRRGIASRIIRQTAAIWALLMVVAWCTDAAPSAPDSRTSITIGDHDYKQRNGSWYLASDTGQSFLVDPEVITVKFNQQVSRQAQSDLHASLDTRVLRTNRLGYADIQVDTGSDVIDIARRYLGSGLVATAEPNTIGRYLVIPDDPLFPAQWHLDQVNDADIDAPLAWEVPAMAPRVIVGILDSGTDWTHDDMGLGADSYQNIFLHSGEEPWADPDDPNTGNGVDDDNNGFIDDWKGWDFHLGNNDARSSADHGTRVAGIVGAKTNNGFGVAGVAGGFGTPGVQLMTLGIGVSYPVGSVMDDAILYAADNGARIITMSLTVGESSAINDALIEAFAAGVLIDCASGNNNGAPVAYPANNPLVIAVGATNQSDLIASFSARGVDQELAAPGVDIWSCVFNDGFDDGSGTSFAAPIVAGVAALVFAANPQLDNQAVRQLLRDTADQVGPYDYNWNAGMPGHSTELGYGRVNAAAAVMAAVSTAGVSDQAAAVMRPLLVEQNRPNPFNPSTVISYTLTADSRVSVAIMTPLGRNVVTLVEEAQPAGPHSIAWDGRDAVGKQTTSGVYFYRIQAGEQVATRKMLLVK